MTATVHPDHILKELAKLWVSMGTQDSPEASAGVLRACAMTLVVLADGDEDPVEVGETVAQLMREHPSRAIVVRLYDSADTQLEAKVLAQCWLPFGSRKQICCEQVEITAAEASLGDVARVVAPLTVADLPLIVWNRIPGLLDRSGFVELAKTADKLVVDTSTFPEAGPALKKIAELADSGVPVADLAWARLTRWRELIAQIFENPAYLAALPQLRSATILFGGREAPAAALYLRAWLDTCIRQGGGSVEFAFESVPNAQEGSIVKVNLADGANRICIRKVAGGSAEVTVNSLTNCTIFRDSNDYVLLREELSISGSDPIFERTLAAVAARANA